SAIDLCGDAFHGDPRRGERPELLLAGRTVPLAFSGQIAAFSDLHELPLRRTWLRQGQSLARRFFQHKNGHLPFRPQKYYEAGKLPRESPSFTAQHTGERRNHAGDREKTGAARPDRLAAWRRPDRRLADLRQAVRTGSGLHRVLAAVAGDLAASPVFGPRAFFRGKETP